jgi:LemA protein
MIWIIWVLLFLAAGWIIWVYNGMVALRHQIQNAWTQIEDRLKRRYDLIPNLAETVKGYTKIDQETLQAAIAARSRAMASSGVKETAEAQSALGQSLGKIFALIENYPELKANENLFRLQKELTTAENQIASARQYYNDLVMRFNMKQEVFPSNMIAAFFRLQPGEFFSAPEREKAPAGADLKLPA